MPVIDVHAVNVATATACNAGLTRLCHEWQLNYNKLQSVLIYLQCFWFAKLECWFEPCRVLNFMEAQALPKYNKLPRV